MQLWFVGNEEQSCLIWPTIVEKTNNYFCFFLGFFIGGCALRVLLFYLFVNGFASLVVFLFKINIVALGAFGAYLYYAKHAWINFIYRNEVQIISWIVLAYSLLVKALSLRGYVNEEINSFFIPL